MRLTDERIGAELSALRELPGEAFAAGLDRRVETGFPSAKKVKQGRELTWGRLLPVLGGLAAVAVVAVVISNNGSNSNVDLQSRDAGSQGAPAEIAAPGAGLQVEKGRAAGTAAAPKVSVAGNGRPRIDRSQVQERSASIGFSTDADKLENAANGVVQVTDRYDGIVDSSTVHAGGSSGHASFALRIPTQHLNDAMTDLSDLGRVTTRDTGSTNVTGAYVDAGKAYADARAKVDSLLQQLQAASPSETPAIRLQLDAAREQLAAARTALRGLKQRVAYTPVSVEITAHGDGAWSIGDAADDAVGVLEAIGGATLIALAALVPLGALLAIAWFGTREIRRRRREAPLDG
jgi:hypothetical protein